MVGVVDSPSSSPNAHEKEPETPPERWWKNIHFNPIQLRVPAQGKLSPKLDESCITLCNQTARGRTQGNEPICYSFCIRRVFEHEVRQLTSHFSFDTALHNARQQQQLIGEGKLKKGELRYPLPPEGQPSKKPKKVVTISLLDDDEDDEYNNDDYDDPQESSSGGISPSQQATNSPQNINKTSEDKDKNKSNEVRYWKEGWYLWMTKSRWASQERIDLMMLDLDKQTQWLQAKEQEEQAWAEQQQQREKHRRQEEEESLKSGTPVSSHVQPSTFEEEAHNPDSINNNNNVPRPPYPTPSDTLLVRLPTTLPPSLTPFTPLTVYLALSSYTKEKSERIQDQIFRPTGKVLGILRQSFENGNQRELARKAYELTKEGKPFLLVKNVVKTCSDYFRSDGGDKDR